MLRMVTDRN